MLSDFREELALFDGHLPFYEDFSDLIFKIESYLEDKDAYKRTYSRRQGRTAETRKGSYRKVA